MALLAREDGKQVYYEVHGSGPRAIVLIHGWGMSCRTWDNALHPLLGAGYRVLLMDHRGCGQSDKDFADMGIDAIAGDVVALVEELGLDTVVLNGWSLGGAVAVAAAASLGQRCAGLVLTGGASPIYTQKPDLPLGGTDADLAGTVEAINGNRVAVLAELSRAVCAMDVGEAVEQRLWQIFCDASPRATATLAELGPLDQRELLASLDVPILSFVGTEDGFVDPDICRWVGDHCSHAELVEFQGVGHAPFLEVTEQYNAALLDYLAKLD